MASRTITWCTLKVKFQGQRRHVICTDPNILAYLNAACSPANGSDGGGIDYDAEFTFADGTIIRAGISIGGLHSFGIARPSDEGWFDDRYFSGVTLAEPQPAPVTQMLKTLLDPVAIGEKKF